MTEFDEDDGPTDLYPCKICGRSFAEAVLKKHKVVCAKNAKHKRKVFDSSKQRQQGLEAPEQKNLPSSVQKEREFKLAQIEQRKKQWRQKHQEFINSIRAAREFTEAKKTGAPLPPPPPPSVDPSLIQCEFCGRRFSEQAAERHIKFCEEKHLRTPGAPAKRGKPNSKPHQGDVEHHTELPVRSGHTTSTHRASATTSNQGGHNATAVRGPSASKGPTRTDRKTTPSTSVTNDHNRIAPPTTYTRGQSNRPTPSSRDSNRAPSGLAKPAPSPSFGSNEVPANCARSQATGKARYVPCMQVQSVHRGSRIPVPTPPGILNVGRNNIPRDPSTLLRSGISRGDMTLDSPPFMAFDVDPHKFADEVYHARTDVQRRGSHKSGNTRPSRRRYSQDSYPSSSYPDSARNGDTEEDDDVMKYRGVVLRSGRTQEDYRNAREFARDLVREKVRLPRSTPISSQSFVSQRLPVVPSSNSLVSVDSTTEEFQAERAPEFQTPSSNAAGAVCLVCPEQSSCSISNNDTSEQADVRYSPDKYTDANNYGHLIFTQPQSRDGVDRTTNSTHSHPGGVPAKQARGGKCCNECGCTFPNPAMKFCPECGVRRMAV
ncbi:unnamed protein product [Calicophoron daubneyi]|uniref:C2HC/C3H-type domain-containing protein n=1 Tax=Calicophoron daubneyi TaxID=300641 RepID=A0AAV2TVY6_CALDB